MHSFVVTRFSPTRTARNDNISTYVERPIAALPTRRFLALRLFAPDLGWAANRPGYIPILCVISPGKPTGEAAGCYFALDSAGVEEPEDKILSVEPRLPSYGRPLYLHTYPKLFDEPYYPDSSLDPASTHCTVCANPSPHRLTNDSFELLCQTIKVQSRRKYEQVSLDRDKDFSLDGRDLDEKAWDSWSGKSVSRPDRTSFWYVFDHLPFKPEDLPVLSVHSVVDEVLLYNEYVFEYFRYAAFSITLL